MFFLFYTTRVPLHLAHASIRKVLCIHIAREASNLQRRDLFKPAQYLRTHLNQLPLLRLRTQATCYISHLPSQQPHIHSTIENVTVFAPLTFVTNLWIANFTSSSIAPTLLPSPNLPSKPLPAPSAGTTSALGPLKQHPNKPPCYSASSPKLLRQHDKAWAFSARSLVHTSHLITQVPFSQAPTLSPSCIHTTPSQSPR